MANSVFISLKSICKTYNKTKKILDNFNLDIEEGSFVTIIGSSGSGKTSILNLISGFTQPDEGQILLNGIDIKDIPANQRPTATVFQDYALFSHMNVSDNISYGLKKMYTDKPDIKKHVYDKLFSKQQKANTLSKKKITELDIQIDKYNQMLQKYEEKWFSKPGISNNIFTCFYVQTIKNRIVDLDYWTSYWKYYPVLMQKKLKEKYLQRPFNKAEISEKISEAIELVGLQGYENESISELSGGTKQKVALARSLITKPKILLLDEPLAAIDKKVREKMQLELKKLHHMLKITFVLITHDQKEALMLSDKIVVLNNGVIEQIGTSNEVYDSPVNPWVASFMGKANLFEGKYLSPGYVLVRGKIFQTDVREGFVANEKAIVMIRPEDYDVVAYDKGVIPVKVQESIYKGQLWELKCLFHDEIIYVENIDEVNVGDEIGLTWDPMDVHVMKHADMHH